MQTTIQARDPFDPATAPDPFERRPPELHPDATDRERALAKKYTRISYVTVEDDNGGVVPDASLAWLVVDQQSWRITPSGMIDLEISEALRDLYDAGHYLAKFCVDVRYWDAEATGYCDTREHASWHCWMMAKALIKIIDAERPQ